MLKTFKFIFIRLNLPAVLTHLVGRAITNKNGRGVLHAAIFVINLILVNFIKEIVITCTAKEVAAGVMTSVQGSVCRGVRAFSRRRCSHVNISSLIAQIAGSTFVLVRFTRVLLHVNLVAFVVVFTDTFVVTHADPRLSIVLLPTFPTLLIVVLIVNGGSRPLSRTRRRGLSSVGNGLERSLSNVHIVETFMGRTFRTRHFRKIGGTCDLISGGLFHLVT